MTNKHELIALDFAEQDSVALLEMLITLCRQNKVGGLIYAASLKHGRTRDVICGTTGRLAEDVVEAAGLAAMLAYKITQEAVEKHQGQ